MAFPDHLQPGKPQSELIPPLDLKVSRSCWKLAGSCFLMGPPSLLGEMDSWRKPQAALSTPWALPSSHCFWVEGGNLINKCQEPSEDRINGQTEAHPLLPCTHLYDKWQSKVRSDRWTSVLNKRDGEDILRHYSRSMREVWERERETTNSQRGHHSRHASTKALRQLCLLYLTDSQRPKKILGRTLGMEWDPRRPCGRGEG
jgi:hypothetical protein